MEVLAIKTPSCKRTAEWTQNEKDVILDKLQTGRKPLIELVQALNGTKSLRQVAEFIEKLEFWKQIISQDPDHSVNHEEAEEASDEQVLAEDMQAYQLGSEERDLFKLQPTKRRKNNANDVIQQKALQNVVRQITKKREMKLPDETFAYVEELLRDFLRPIIFQIAIEAKLIYTNSGSNGKSRVIQLEDMEKILQECGFAMPETCESEAQDEDESNEVTGGDLDK